MFVRVRSAREGDPKHVFDVSVVEYAAHPDLYEVLDREPVSEARPPLYVTPDETPAEPVDAPEKPAKKRK